MIKIPDQSRFPGTGDKGNGIPENFKTQEQWLNFIKTNGCGNCHQIGNYATRTISRQSSANSSRRRTRGRYRLSVGPAGHDMVRFITQLMTPDGGHLDGARRLDRPHQGRRTAEPQPAAAGRRRAQHRRHGARLARPEALSARSDDDRPAQSDGQRLWPDLRRHRAQQQCAAGARPGAQHKDHDPAAGPRRHAEFGARQPGRRSVALLGHGADLGQQGQCAHLGDGPGRARLLGGAEPLAEGHPGLLQEGLAVALGPALSARRAA